MASHALQPSPDSPVTPKEVAVSTRGHMLLLFCGALALLGIIQTSWIFLVAGVGGWVALLLMLLQFRTDLLQGLEHNQLQGLFEQQAHTSFRAGQLGTIHFHLRGVRARFRIRKLEMHHSAYLSSHISLRGQHNELRSSQTFQSEVTLTTPVAGKFMLHGMALHLEDPFSLFRASRYIHCPESLRVLPKTPISRAMRRGNKPKIFIQQHRGAPQRRPGSGTNLHDIREYRPGDPRRLIAWKHSLRHRKLLCREFESESPLTTYLLLDIGQSMREGDLGERKLDAGCEIISAFAKSATEQRDSVGLITFDGAIYQHHKPASGQKQFHAILHHLTGLHQIVDRDFAHTTLGSLCHFVGQYLWREGMLAGPGGRVAPSSRQTVEFVWDTIQSHPDLSLPKEWESDQELIDTVLRAFCKHIGLEIPYRYRQWVTYKAAGLRASLDAAINHMQGGQLIVVLSDLGDILHWDGIQQSLRRARQKKHHVVFLSPFSPWFSKPARNESEERAILRELLTLEQWNWRTRIQQMTNPLGIPLLSLDADTAPQILLQRLQKLRLGGRF